MAVINTIKALQANVQHWTTNKINFYKNIRTEDPDILLLNKHRVRNNGQIKIYGYKTEWKNVSNQARDRAVIAIKRNICHRIINNLSNNTVACKIQTGIGPIIIATMYIPQRRPIIPKSRFRHAKTSQLSSLCSMCWVTLMEAIVNWRIDKLMIQENN